MVLGAFLPIVSLPIVGTVNYFNNGQGDGIFIVLLAAIAAALAFTKASNFAWVPAALGGVLVGFTVLNLISRISAAQAELSQSLAGNPFAGLAEGLMGSVQIQFGWVVIVIGVCLAVFGSISRDKPDPVQGDVSQ
jgi:hypothetical protein